MHREKSDVWKEHGKEQPLMAHPRWEAARHMEEGQMIPNPTTHRLDSNSDDSSIYKESDNRTRGGPFTS